MIFAIGGERFDTAEMLEVDPSASPYRGIYVTKDHTKVFAVVMSYDGVGVKRLRGDTLRIHAISLNNSALTKAADIDASK